MTADPKFDDAKMTSSGHSMTVLFCLTPITCNILPIILQHPHYPSPIAEDVDYPSCQKNSFPLLGPRDFRALRFLRHSRNARLPEPPSHLFHVRPYE